MHVLILIDLRLAVFDCSIAEFIDIVINRFSLSLIKYATPYINAGIGVTVDRLRSAAPFALVDRLKPVVAAT